MSNSPTHTMCEYRVAMLDHVSKTKDTQELDRHAFDAMTRVQQNHTDLIVFQPHRHITATVVKKCPTSGQLVVHYKENKKPEFVAVEATPQAAKIIVTSEGVIDANKDRVTKQKACLHTDAVKDARPRRKRIVPSSMISTDKNRKTFLRSKNYRP